MIIGKDTLPFIKQYIDGINEKIKAHNGAGLTRIQSIWLGFVLMGILVTNSLCFERFKKSACGDYKVAALSWMFRRAKIAWDLLLQASVMYIIESYGIKSGILVIDDTSNERSKNTTKIANVHKMKDKGNGGFFNGQNIVFLLLVSQELTLPVGFKFFSPDPAKTAFSKEDKILRKKGVAKEYRGVAPADNPDYPSKKELAISMIETFVRHYPHVRIKATVADAEYGKKDFMNKAYSITGDKQVISQIAKNQLINVNGVYIQTEKFFSNYQGKMEEVELRYTNKKIRYCSARFKIKSHEAKYYIVAIKYDEEPEYRYLIAKDMTWLDIDIIKAYATRWLVEVFIQDWKSYEGWHELAKQQGIEGSDRGLTLSLLCDHMLYFHNDQLTLFKNKKQAVTVGSLREKVVMESLVNFVKKIVISDYPKQMLEELAENIDQVFKLRISLKHLRNFDNSKDAPMISA